MNKKLDVTTKTEESYEDRKDLSTARSYKKFIGMVGENIACKFLSNNGWQILGRNIYYKHGELDIVALKNNFLVFFEVKTRTNKNFGGSIYSLSNRKISNLEKLAKEWLVKNSAKFSFKKYRIDAILIDIDSISQGSITHVKGIKNG